MTRTMQEIFDIGAAGVIAQGRPAIDRGLSGGSNLCAYRGEGGCKCFLGQLIPDDAYSPKLEGLGPSDPELTDAMGLGPDYVGEFRDQFLKDCQAAHDDAAVQVPTELFLTEFRARARRVATQWGLDPEVVL